MNSFTMRKLLWMTVMAVMPLLGAAHASLSVNAKQGFRAGISNAIMADVHRKIALNCWENAERLDAEAKEFAAVGDAYRNSPLIFEQRQPTPGLKASLYYGLADDYEKMAHEARDLADIHEEMARSLLEEGGWPRTRRDRWHQPLRVLEGEFVD